MTKDAAQRRSWTFYEAVNDYRLTKTMVIGKNFYG